MKRLLTLIAVLALALPEAHAELALRQATASQTVMVGPFVSANDPKTPATSLTIGAEDVRISVNGGNIVAKNSGGCTHDELGMYACTFDATDTASVGRMQIAIACTVATCGADTLVLYQDFQVYEETVFDKLYATGATGRDGVFEYGTAQGATSTTLQLRAAASYPNNYWNGATVVITGGTGAGQSREIKAYTGATDTATVEAWVTTPSSDSTYEIFGTSPTGDIWTVALPGSYSAGQAGFILGQNLDAAVSSRASDAKIDVIDDYIDSEIGQILANQGTISDLGSGATIGDNLKDIEAQTDDIGLNGAGLTEAGGNGDHLTEAGGTGDQLTAVASQASVAAIQTFLEDLSDGSAVFMGCTFSVSATPPHLSVSSCTAP